MECKDEKSRFVHICVCPVVLCCEFVKSLLFGEYEVKRKEEGANISI